MVVEDSANHGCGEKLFGYAELGILAAFIRRKETLHEDTLGKLVELRVLPRTFVVDAEMLQRTR